jgi:hypothetical protein
MQPIVAPIGTGESGAHVANLQDALHLLIDSKVLRTSPHGPTDEEIAKQARELANERQRSIYSGATERLVRYLQLQEGLGDGGAVETKTAARLNEILASLGAFDEPADWVVRGKVRDGNGGALPGLAVQAIDRDLRPKRSQPLAPPVVTGERGAYEIRYSARRFARAEAGGPDIQVQAFDSPALERLLGESTVFYNAGRETTIDLTLGDAARQPSEFEAHVARVLRLLEGQADDGGDLRLIELTAPDIEFIAGETAIAVQHLEWLRASHESAEELGAEPAAAACYGWFRSGVDARVEPLRAQSPRALRQSLIAAVDENIVPAWLRDGVDDVLELIGNQEWRSVKGLLDRAGMSGDKVRVIAEALDSVEAIDETTLRGFLETGALDVSQAHRLGLTASLHRLTAANDSMLELALTREFPAVGNRRLRRTEDLARLSNDDWIVLVRDSGAAPPDGSTIEAYATELEEAAVGAYPTVGMLHRAVRNSPESGLASVAARNPDVDLLSLDLTTNSPHLAALDLGELTDDERKEVTTGLRAMQRMLTAAEHPTRARKLLDAGYLGMTQIALATQANLMESAGLTEREAMQVLDRARTFSLQAVHAWMAVRDAEVGRQMINGTGKALLSISAAEAQLVDWAEMFGPTDYCDCDHCLSVLGPAAYFVDLMRYVEKFILEPSSGVDVGKRLTTRRKDLWEDKLLSCKSTDEIVPTLEIVNELLERRITAARPAWATSLDIHRGIADPASSVPHFGLPVNFPLDRVEVLLAHFGLSRDRIVHVLAGSVPARIQARLKTWPAELELIQAPKADDANAEPYFLALYRPGGVAIPNGPGFLDQALGAFDLGDLADVTGVDLDVLRLLVTSAFVSTDDSGVTAVAVTVTATPGAAQNTMEAITNLTRRRLDRLHRLIRLWRKVPWTVTELDYALTRLAPEGTTVVALDDATLAGLVDLLDLGETTSLAFEEVMALWDGLPGEGFRGKPSLFDRRFNAEPYARDATWPANGLPGNLALPATSSPTDSTAARVQSALRMNDADFAALVDALEEVEIPDPAPSGPLVRLVEVTSTDRWLRLSTPTLSVLYRHALLCKVLEVKPAVLMRLVRLTPEIVARAADRAALEAQYITGLSDVMALLRFVAWQRASGFTVEDLGWLADPTHPPDGAADPSTVAERVITRIAADRLVVFPATLFAAAGFSEPQSLEIMAGLEGSAVERTVVQTSRAGAAAHGSAPQEVDYRLKSGLTRQKLEDLVIGATKSWAFDIAQIAVLGLARHLGEFQDTAFMKLFLTEQESQDLVQRNLDDGQAASPRRAFVSFKTAAVPPALRYRLNPAFLGASAPEPILMPLEGPRDPIDLAGRLVLGFMKQKATDVTRGTPSAAHTVSDTLFTEIFLSEQQSRWLVAFNPIVVPNPADPGQGVRAFLPDPVGTSRILNVSAIERARNPPALSDVLRTIQLRAADLLRGFDPVVVADREIAIEIGMAPDVVGVLRSARAAVRAGLGGVQTVDPAEIFGDLAPPTALATLAGQLPRLARLFAGTHFDAAAIRFVLDAWDTAFAEQGTAPLGIGRLKAIAAYAGWLRLPEHTPGEPPDPKHEARRQALDVVATGNPAPSDAQLARVLDATDPEIRSLEECAHLWQGTWHEQLDRARTALAIARRLGVGGRTLTRIGGFDPADDVVEDLFKAADDIYGAFRATYPDDATYREKSEAFEDIIRGKRRDALVAHIAANFDDLRTASAMYAHFLIDVQAGGCARTSRLVAAISSLQLFVHRVLMGLEPARFGDTKDAEDARGQWFWRKNYRVWEANRKVFLFPENFIEPDLRDDKTPLFRTLEEELLQRRITTGEAEESYRNYLTGYSEVAGLAIVGAFHDVQTGRDLGLTEAADDIFIDVLHLVGVTADDPPIHYLRRIGNVTRSRLADGAKYPIQFSPWEKVSTQIPARWVSPVVHLGKLRLFWNEITTVSTARRVKEQTVTILTQQHRLKEGTYFNGYKHRFRVKAIDQKASRGWTAPQELTFLDESGVVRRAVEDPLMFVVSDDFRTFLSRLAQGDPAALSKLIDQVLTPNLLLPYLEQDQSEVSASPEAVLFGTDVAAPLSLFRAAPRTQPHSVWSSTRHHGEAQDEFTVAGWNWDRVYPAVRYRDWNIPGDPDEQELLVTAMNEEAQGFVAPANRTVEPFTFPRVPGLEPSKPWAAAVPGFVRVDRTLLVPPPASVSVGNPVWDATRELHIAPVPAGASAVVTSTQPIGDALVVNARAPLAEPAGSSEPFRPSCTFQSGNLQALLVHDPSRHQFINLSTSTATPLIRRLATGSVPGLLEKKFQMNLEENLTPVTLGGSVADVRGTAIDFATGAYGTYLREIFFHVPFLIANHLNGQQRFEDAQRWYHYIFNPMAPDLDGSWRYREFVGLRVDSLRKMLTDPVALAAYRNDPFNPHAIARLRLQAYQKAIVMKYIDNLLDWGDRLFTQFTMESVNEAMMLYVLASDILGDRPKRLGKCNEETARSYADVKPSLTDTSDFLIEEMEHVTLVIPKGGGMTIRSPGAQKTLTRALRAATGAATAAGGEGDVAPLRGTAGPGFDGDPLPHAGGAGLDPADGARYWSSPGGRPLADLTVVNGTELAGAFTAVGTESRRFVTPPIDFEGGSPGGGIFGDARFGGLDLDPVGLRRGTDLGFELKFSLHDAPPAHRDVFTPQPPPIVPQELVPARNIFCFPVNRELLAYHDRVTDRLTKIRNCMDIAGVRRRLALFAPEIDPRLLVRMKAAGLSLDDVLDATTGHAPPYRFAFLLERARHYAATVQGLGGHLLSAMEKRDGEELAVLRTVHEQHLLDLRSQSMRLEIDAATDALAGLQRQKEAAELRQQHFDSLIAGGLIAHEQAQQALGTTAAILTGVSGILHMVAGIAAAIPQTHVPAPPSPVSAETGGISVHAVLSSVAAGIGSTASVADAASRLAGTQASFERRTEDWKFQADVARKDVAQLAKQVEAAGIRVAIAERGMEVHQKSLEQTREVFDFYRSKFSSHGLYTWLSTQLNRYHRQAFDAAWNMARMAEKALHFERPELRETVFLGAPAWSPERAGLLGGESLLLDLQRLEASYLLTNARELELEQSFSLAQYCPHKLIELRQTGECDFDVPELFFDLSYPGQYFRRIKAVRLNLPCVVGPHTSIAATLRMMRSLLRDAPDAARPLADVPLRHAPTIAASSAQGDAGVFEFSFRDERLLPFEGMGAVSSWNLRLPREMRPFKYDTISDVVLRISYTARQDDGLRASVDTQNGVIFARLRDAAPRVALSLRRDFPTAWAKFQNDPPIDGRYAFPVSLTEMSYPFWLRERVDAQEDLGVHVLFERAAARTIDVKLGGGEVQELEQTPSGAAAEGVRWTGGFPAGKASRDLSLSFNRKDMTDVIMVLAPTGQG